MKKISHIYADFGFIGLLDFIRWLFKTYFEKFRIRFEDAYRLNSFQTWIRNIENKKHSKIAEPFLQPTPLASFLIYIRYLDDDLCKALKNTVASIEQQIIPNWEIVLIGAPDIFLNDKLWDKWISNQKLSIHPVLDVTDKNSAIREALPFVGGKWTIWSKPGDIYTEDLLSQLLPLDGAIIYWDEDILKNNQRCSPFFKPDWSPELWLSIDLLYCMAIQTDFIKGLLFENEQDFIIPVCIAKAKKIIHIPEILSHSRLPAWEDPQELADHELNVKKFYEYAGIQEPSVWRRLDGSIRVSCSTPSEKISIIIPNRNNYAFLSQCVQSIIHTSTYKNYEIIIVDDGSTEERVKAYYQELRASKIEFRIVEGVSPFNFSRACNIGARSAQGTYLLFLNNDTEVQNANWLNELVLFARQDEIGIVGGQLLYPNKTIQHAGIILGLEGHASHIFGGASQKIRTPYGFADWYRNFSAVTGACMMIRRQLFESIGGFDEDFELVFSDIELCLRIIEHGYRVVYNPEASLIHYEGKSRGKFIPGEDIRLGYEKFAGLIRMGDPYYNKNLSLAWRIPTLKRSWEQASVERLNKINRYF